MMGLEKEEREREKVTEKCFFAKNTCHQNAKELGGSEVHKKFTSSVSSLVDLLSLTC